MPNPIDWRGQLTPGLGTIRGNPQLSAASQYIAQNAGNVAGMQDPRKMFGGTQSEDDMLLALLRSLLGEGGMAKLSFAVPPPVIKEKPKKSGGQPGGFVPSRVGVGNSVKNANGIIEESEAKRRY